MQNTALDLAADKAPRIDGKVPSRKSTRAQRMRMARRWINAMLEYGAQLNLIEYGEGYGIQFWEPLEPTGKPSPLPYDKEIAAEVRDVLRVMGRTIDYRHAKSPLAAD
jgi:hypothetical protein